jgi:Ni,Fe-hydrogenase I small subunit
MSGPKQHIDLPGVPVHPDAERFAGLAWMDMKPGVDELRSLSRPIAVYAMRWHENDR